MNTSVLIYSCDAYSDIWGLFFTLFFRYWNCPYQVYLATETEQCLLPEVKTINVNADTWTERIRETVDQIQTDYIIGMCEDMFIRRPVNQSVISNCIKLMESNPNIACFNFEKDYSGILEGQYLGFGQKTAGSEWQKSCQPTLWRKTILQELLDCQMDAWEWESTPADDRYTYYVFTGEESEMVFEYGYRHEKWFGLQKGRWVAEDVIPLFEHEGINIDLSIRGTV